MPNIKTDNFNMYVHLTFLGSNRSDAEEALFGGLTWEKSKTDN